jgi:hypothetical protein
MTVALRVSTPSVRSANRELRFAELEALIHDPSDAVDRGALVRIIVTDVDYECEHGNCAGDWKRDCECWTAERVRALVASHPEARNRLVDLLSVADPFDMAAAQDLAIPVERKQKPDPAVALAAQEAELAAEAHRWYVEPDRSLRQTAGRFDLTYFELRDLFKRHHLPLKERTSGYRQRHGTRIFVRTPPPEEVAVNAPNGQEPDVQAMHDWYMGEPHRTLADTGEAFGISGNVVKNRFVEADLPRKPRGGSRPPAHEDARVQPTDGQGEVEEIVDAVADEQAEAELAPALAGTIVVLERERDRLATRLEKIEQAIATVRELA